MLSQTTITIRCLLFILLLIQSLSLFGNGKSQYEQGKAIILQAKNALTSEEAMTFNYSLSANSLGHLSEPWQTYKTEMAGVICFTGQHKELYRLDSILVRDKYLYSKQYYSMDNLFRIPFGKTEPAELTQKDAAEYLNTASTLSPVPYLDNFLRSGMSTTTVTTAGNSKQVISYRKQSGDHITITMDEATSLVTELLITYPHDMYGDVTRKITYSEYTVHPVTGRFFPARIIEEELGITTKNVRLSISTEPFDCEGIRALIPDGYALPEPKVMEEVLTWNKYNDQVYLLELEHADAQVMVVEFRNFLLVEGAPLSPANGEMIIRKISEEIPDKPIRYFAFGHHHPHYLGGVRSFVANGTTVLCHTSDSAYVNQLVSFRHSLNPDLLEKNPLALQLEFIDSIKTITDGELELQIIHIGMTSDHTKDYLIFYIPKYNLLFEDDLVWIARDKPLAAAGSRQKGVYDSIIKHQLKVDTIVQGWPVKRYNVKTIISFEELKQSVGLSGAN